MPRFVLLTHDHPHWHWDFMLESQGQLRTWRLDADPCTAQLIQATPLADHRLQYLHYEGPVSQNRGHVHRVDRGEYEVLTETQKTLQIALRGEKLQGRVSLNTDTDGAVTFQYSASPSPEAKQV